MADNFKDRILGLDRKPADQFQAHPHNPRIHPQVQRDAVNGSLKALGWVGVPIENVRTGNLLDGHERVWQALQNDNDTVPYLQVDLDPEEEALFLATFDYTTTLAYYDPAALNDILDMVQTDNAELMAMLAMMAEEHGITPPDFAPVDIDLQPRLDQKKSVVCPHCGEEFTPT
jgi:hypothetical protein